MGQPGTSVFIWIGGVPPMPPVPGWLKERVKEARKTLLEYVKDAQEDKK